MNNNDKELLQQLEKKIGYHFQDYSLLKQALTHSSYANEKKIQKLKDYERMEFLGDAVLELVTSEYLYLENTNRLEGEMTKLRSTYVCEPALAFCAREIALGQFIYCGKGESRTGGKDRDSILSDCMEAIIGAIYLDGGLEQAKKFIHRGILTDLENKRLFYDSKSSLQEMVQGKRKQPIAYRLTGESGPEHEKCFQVEVLVGDVVVGSGSGKSKKIAEQNAAYQAILQLKKEKA
ncbi:MAG: ribonuclease III [Eubacteriales bacterium]